MDGTNHIVELAAERAPHDGEDDRAHDCADEALDGLLWGELDERRAAHGDTADVRKDVVANDEARRDEEPDESFENTVDDEVAEPARQLGQQTTSIVNPYLETTMSKIVICTQQNRPNCCLR